MVRYGHHPVALSAGRTSASVKPGAVDCSGTRTPAEPRRSPAPSRRCHAALRALPPLLTKTWIGAHAFHAEILGLERLDQPDAQRAVDAMIGSVRLRLAKPAARWRT